MNVVARQIGAGGNRVKNIVGRATETRIKPGDVERGQVLILQFAMFDYRVLATNKLGDSIRETTVGAGADMIFEQRQPATLISHDQIARERGRIGLSPRGNKEQMNRMV